MDINTQSVSTVSQVAQSSVTQKSLEVMQPEMQESKDSITSPKQSIGSVATKDLQPQVAQVNESLANLGQGILFSVDDSTRSSVLKVVDKETDEVIKQYPSEDSLRVLKNIQEYLNSVQMTGLSPKEGLTGSLFSEII